MFDIIQYNATYKNEWNDFIARSRNGTFLFHRDYMDYHSDRYKDCSFLFLSRGNICAVLPANVVENVLHSHQGLTYGGLIISPKVTVSDVMLLFKQLGENLKNMGVTKVIYKPVPHIYHKLPSQEDIYTLFRLNAKKIGCAVSTAVFQHNKPGFSELRRRGIKKAQKENLTVLPSEDFHHYMNLVNNNLTNKYGTSAVHSSHEIMRLHSLFPENIQLFVVENAGEMVAGVIVYVMSTVVHVQYIVVNESGKKSGALDLLFDQLINNRFAEIPVFDFGTSTENQGQYLNENLIFQKEGFGGRGIVYETYEYMI
jgi:hypothetical protein